ncbi:potassium channel family protein [Herbaspirillum sp. ST 5-3]|uniref:potassium channel family protein n=1 Tax=Oxalobacteraceae TaxID=75682 RepID=UPI0010A32B65|nr:potassium channel family protein [Herbaspirillum sp. ST 5-3]
MLIYLFTVYKIFRDSLYYQRLRNALLLMFAVHVLGTIGYLAISGGKASVLDALYMVFITVATIGYSEVIDMSNSPAGRVFTMIVGFTGIGTLTYLFSAITAFVLETNINHAYRRLRMERTIAALSGHYIVCGVGRVGSYIADELLKTERSFVVVDVNEKTVEAHCERTGHQIYLTGDASDDDVLLRAGVERCRGVFAVSGDDSKNLVISLSARQLNPAVRIVARVHDPRNADKTRRAGADEIVSPDFTGGMRLASAMLRPHAVSFMDMMLRTENNLRVEEVVVPNDFRPCTIAELGPNPDWMLVAIRTGDKWVFNPGPTARIEPGQALISIVSPAGRRALEAAVGASGTLESGFPL